MPESAKARVIAQFELCALVFLSRGNYGLNVLISKDLILSLSVYSSRFKKRTLCGVTLYSVSRYNVIDICERECTGICYVHTVIYNGKKIDCRKNVSCNSENGYAAALQHST